MKRVTFASIVIAVSICIGSLVQAQSSALPPYAGPRLLTVHGHNGPTLADGRRTLVDVTLEVRGVVLKADQMIYNASAQDFELLGNVRVTLPSQFPK